MDNDKWWVKRSHIDNGHGYELDGYYLMYGDKRIKEFSWTRGIEEVTNAAATLNNIFDELDGKIKKTKKTVRNK